MTTLKKSFENSVVKHLGRLKIPLHFLSMLISSCAKITLLRNVYFALLGLTLNAGFAARTDNKKF